MSFQPLASAMRELTKRQKHTTTGANATTITGLSGSRTAMRPNEKENGARLRRGTGATWTGSPKGVFSGRKHHKPRLSLDNNTAGVCEREDVNRTREAGNRDEVEGVAANTLNGACGKRSDMDGRAEGRKSGS